MSLKCGIVGLPNVGKSTLFNSLTNMTIPAENYPFCTIEPNVGVVEVNDSRLDTIKGIVNPEKVIPAIVEFVDIAGLVKGASNGEGLGNKFLSNIRETDAIAHVFRLFDSKNVTHVSGKVDPMTDIDVINTELIISDLVQCEKLIEKVKNSNKSQPKSQIDKSLSILENIKNNLEKGIFIKNLNFSNDDAAYIKNFNFLTNKPMMYIANVSEDFFIDKKKMEEVEKFCQSQNSPLIYICAKLEHEISQLSPIEKKEFLLSYGIEKSGLDEFISAGYNLLGLSTFFTAGPKELKAWTYRSGMLAPETAGVIHTDFQRGFIRAEVISYEDFVKFKGETGSKNNGKMRIEGKDYVVQDGDIIFFRFNV